MFFKKGFSLMEVMVSIAIMLVIIGISTRVFQNTNKNQALEKAVTSAVSFINGTRSLALSSKEFCSYGVNISTTSNSISSFIVSDPNCTSNFSSTSLSFNTFGVTLATTSINLVTFAKVTGDASNSGWFKLQLKNDSTSSTTVTVYSTGLIETK